MANIDSKLRNLIQRELVVFDFDRTMVTSNSDTWIHQLAPGKSIPENLQYRHGQDWFHHVRSVFTYLHGQKVTEKDYYECLSQMPPVPGIFEHLVETLGEKPDSYDMIILSDSNSFFINSYLKSRSLDKLFMAVITNPAEFSDDGQLQIKEYHIQDYCTLSSRNLCKGEALKNFIGRRMLDNGTVYTCVNYVGDGENDLCPCTRLNQRDRIFPRRGFSLDRLCIKLANRSENTQGELSKVPDLKAPVFPWTTGKDILDVILGQQKDTAAS